MIDARFIIEAQGRPKSFVENVLKQHVEKMKMIEGVEVYDEHWEPTEEIERGIFSALVDVGVKVDDFETFFALVLGFAPSAVIVQSPEKIAIEL